MRTCIQVTGTHKHTPKQLVFLVSPSVQDFYKSPGGPGCTEPLEVEMLKNIIKCGRAHMTARPLRALTAVRKDLASPC